MQTSMTSQRDVPQGVEDHNTSAWDSIKKGTNTQAELGRACAHSSRILIYDSFAVPHVDKILASWAGWTIFR
jgi:hypothetical protein